MEQAQQGISRAIQYSWDDAKLDGHWIGELKANVTLTAEHIFFYQSLPTKEKPRIPQADEYMRYLLKEQTEDGSWTIAPGYPGDVSTTVEAYLALRILGVAASTLQMKKARDFILAFGGVAELPTEFILAPSWCPMNIYNVASWARSTTVPLLLIAHHRPVYALPNGMSANNSFIDELWVNPSNKMVPLGPSLTDLGRTDWVTYLFSSVDKALWVLNGLRNNPIRSFARKQCIDWILEHQEDAGDWAGIIPPMHFGVQALLLEGYSIQSEPIQLALAAIERFTWQDESGKRLQSCISPVWDTSLMLQGLCNAGVDREDERLRKAAEWIKDRQIQTKGDWQIRRPKLKPGGFGFEYHNTWYPDIDDTAAAILSIIQQDPGAVCSPAVTAAAQWVCGMQNSDGGFAGFDADNDKLWLNKIPFSDMGSLCDPSTPDCAGHVVECFGMMMRTAQEANVTLVPAISAAIHAASLRAIDYLVRTQEPTGAWYGRWACNYVFGTCNVLCGLAYFVDSGDDRVRAMMQSGTRWLKCVQNSDGGWGESLETYRDPSLAGRGQPSTPSQTAWALMGLLATCGPDDESVLGGVSHLLRTQTDYRGETAASWPERFYTGTGFPNFFYIGYSLYRHYFPLMALGRFVASVSRQTHV
ncbi:terpenoid cyclases/protein prenyltransferase alpha-alpha toroid [Xylariaceae sp. FL1272]|nr:terpenoid cyclases/protein prenyltransferase alpha-alpha toroid [Xylariaceae sp. FL1272]